MIRTLTFLKSSLVLVLLSTLFVSCEEKKKERPSPLREEHTEFKDGQLKIVYSSPSVTSPDGENRHGHIWGQLVPYDSIWRTGANDATYFQTDVDLQIHGQSLASGSYALFTIPTKNEWQVILNEEWNQWGSYNYDSTLDAARLRVVPKVSDEFSERMRFYFEEDSLKFHWEYLSFSLALE